MLAMSFSRVRESNFDGLRLLKRLGVGGVRAVSADETEHPESEGDWPGSVGDVEGVGSK